MVLLAHIDMTVRSQVRAEPRRRLSLVVQSWKGSMGAGMKVQTRWRNWVLTVEKRAGRAVQNPAVGMCETGQPPAGRVLREVWLRASTEWDQVAGGLE